MKTLVVDDDLMTRIVLEWILSDYAKVDSCGDGNEAVLAQKAALERGDPYDLICMDVFMPVMDGLEALKLIRQEEELQGVSRPRGAKVIMATASVDIATIRQAFQELCDAYIVKPIDAKELLDIVGCLLPIENVSRS
jgi:two-component system chemotaxis response regulator CheY